MKNKADIVSRVSNIILKDSSYVEKHSLRNTGIRTQREIEG